MVILEIAPDIISGSVDGLRNPMYILQSKNVFAAIQQGSIEVYVSAGSTTFGWGTSFYFQEEHHQLLVQDRQQ